MATELPQSFRSSIQLMSGFQNYHPSLDALWQQFEDNFQPQHAPKSHPPRALNVELLLSAGELRTGGHYSISVPVGHVCPRCNGDGQTGFFACDLCQGHGMKWESARVVLFIHPATSDGTIMPVSLEHLGVRNLFLNVQVRATE